MVAMIIPIPIQSTNITYIKKEINCNMLSLNTSAKPMDVTKIKII